MAQVVSIVYKPKAAAEKTATFYRVALDAANLIAGYGIEGDSKGGHRKRQLNILSAETVDALAAEGFRVEPGELGEQIVVRGLDVESLPPGTRFLLGESAVVEVVGLREPCKRLATAQDRPASAVEGRVGIIARVVSSGPIQVGDTVALLQPALLTA